MQVPLIPQLRQICTRSKQQRQPQFSFQQFLILPRARKKWGVYWHVLSTVYEHIMTPSLGIIMRFVSHGQLPSGRKLGQHPRKWVYVGLISMSRHDRRCLRSRFHRSPERIRVPTTRKSSEHQKGKNNVVATNHCSLICDSCGYCIRFLPPVVRQMFCWRS